MEQIPFEDEKPLIHIHPIAAPVADAEAGHDDVTDIHDGHPVHATVDEHSHAIRFYPGPHRPQISIQMRMGRRKMKCHPQRQTSLRMASCLTANQ